MRRRPESARLDRSPLWRPFLVAVATAIGGILLASWPVSGPAEAVANGRPIEISADGFVSSSACRACHPAEYASWFRSFHRTMTQVASSASIVAPFTGSVASVHGGPINLERRGPEFWATFDDPDSRAHQRITRQVTLVTGSHEQQQFWYSTGRDRLLGKLPGVYLIDRRQWVPRQSVFLRPPDTADGSDTGAWNAICISCHTTSGRPRLDVPFGARPAATLRADSEVAEFGIACEACHGPGGSHVRTNQSPWRRYRLHWFGKADPTIVNPARLPAARRSQVCGQCHSIWEFYGIDDERAANSHGLPYRPGDDLTRSRFEAQPTVNAQSQTFTEILADDPRFLVDSFWTDGMVRVSGREYSSMIESPCFRLARDDSRTIACTSCHQLHTEESAPAVDAWAEGHQMGVGMNSNEACFQCHAGFRARLREHTRHQSDAANSCYNCHMPYTTYGLLRALRSHQISVPDASATLATGRPNACNLCHLDKSLKWSAKALEARWGRPVPDGYDRDGDTSASVLWLLRGDAGQRALAAWAFGWKPAMDTSGTGWLAPLLAATLDDPYDAVRMIAMRSLSRQPGFEGTTYDIAKTRSSGSAAAKDALAQWQHMAHAPLGSGTSPAAVLLNPTGTPMLEEIQRLRGERDNRALALRE